MKIAITQGRVLDPASGLDHVADVAIDNGSIVALNGLPAGFTPEKTIDAKGCWVLPGLVDLYARVHEPNKRYGGKLESELQAAVAGGVTSLVCPPDTKPVLDEAGLVEMLRQRANSLHLARVLPLGALTRQLEGEVLSEMTKLTESGCVGFSHSDVPVRNTLVLQRALQYASTFGYSVWLRPEDAWLGGGVAASGALAMRMGLSGVPVLAETIAINTIIELMKTTGARVHLSRLSSAEGVELVRQAKAKGLPLTCDVSIHSLHLIDVDMGYFDSRARLIPPLRQDGDRQALRRALADGTIDALVSDHTPVCEDDKILPFAEAVAGGTGLELLLPMALRWANDANVPLLQALATVTSQPVQALGDAALPGMGQLQVGGVADVCVYNPATIWQVQASQLQSQGKYTPFDGMEIQGRVCATVVAGRVAFQAA